MIKLEIHDNISYISFTGNSLDFNNYIYNLMKVPSINFNSIKSKWYIHNKDLVLLKSLFEIISEENYSDIGALLKLPPYNYQKEAMKFGIDNLNTLQVLPCGSGKTIIGIGAFLEAKQRKIISGPGMIVVKASLKVQWSKEIEKFSDLKANIVTTYKDLTSSYLEKIKRRKSEEEKNKLQQEANELFANQFKGYDLFVLNYETLRDKQVRQALHKANIDFVMADEIHYVKNRASKRSKSLYEFNNVKLKIGATATPIAKNPEDLYGIFKFLMPDLLDSWAAFSRKHIKFGGYGKIIGFKNLDQLRSKILPYTIVKTKEEVSKQLPKLIVSQRYCDFNSKQLDCHEKIMNKLEELKQQEKNIRNTLTSEKEISFNEDLKKIEALILAHQTFAQQLANSEELLMQSNSEMSKEFITNSNSNKLELCVELLEEILESGEKVAIFSRFKKMQDVFTERFKKEFSGAKICYINGALSGQERYDQIQKFSNKDDYKILLMTNAGSEGLNLSKCKYLIEYEPAESYGTQTQRHGRIERADSIHDTAFVYQLICNNSWDEIALKIIEKKEAYDQEILK